MSKWLVNVGKWWVNARKRGTIVALSTTFLFLAACAPFQATLVRGGDNVTITVSTGSTALTLVGVTILGQNLSASSAACTPLDAEALSCDLGDLPANTVTTLLVTGVDVSCIATGYAGGTATDYRVARCSSE